MLCRFANERNNGPVADDDQFLISCRHWCVYRMADQTERKSRLETRWFQLKELYATVQTNA